MIEKTPTLESEPQETYPNSTIDSEVRELFMKSAELIAEAKEILKESRSKDNRAKAAALEEEANIISQEAHQKEHDRRLERERQKQASVLDQDAQKAIANELNRTYDEAYGGDLKINRNGEAAQQDQTQQIEKTRRDLHEKSASANGNGKPDNNVFNTKNTIHAPGEAQSGEEFIEVGLMSPAELKQAVSLMENINELIQSISTRNEALKDLNTLRDKYQNEHNVPQVEHITGLIQEQNEAITILKDRIDTIRAGAHEVKEVKPPKKLSFWRRLFK